MQANSYRDRLFESPKTDDSKALWYLRHMQALEGPQSPTEGGVLDLIASWLGYADAFRQSTGAGFEENEVTGRAWAKTGLGIFDLLDSEIGRLHAPALQSLIADILSDEGFDADQL